MPSGQVVGTPMAQNMPMQCLRPPSGPWQLLPMMWQLSSNEMPQSSALSSWSGPCKKLKGACARHSLPAPARTHLSLKIHVMAQLHKIPVLSVSTLRHSSSLHPQTGCESRLCSLANQRYRVPTSLMSCCYGTWELC